MFAVIETGGKQYLVKKGSIIKVEKLKADKGKKIEINKVICLLNNGLFYSHDASVEAEVLEQCRRNRIFIFKKKRRKNYRRKISCRQHVTVLRINEINLQK
ncbi:MAG: 50S ribosomal protein L21 [Wolbachia endosymbiont of Meromenopon meropis]|nr:50S ribosomal protein L21 [Wolbachia endosymbiont of Meromenopon meropis]